MGSEPPRRGEPTRRDGTSPPRGETAPHTGAERRGRQAEAARNDHQLLEAARDVISVSGADASVAAIAERAGIGVGSLYRRYPTKEALFQHLCALALEQALRAADAGLRARDPWDGLVGYIRTCVEARTGALAPLAGTIAVTDRMSETNEQSLRRLRELVDRAHRAGVLRADIGPLDITLLIAQFGRRNGALPEDEDANARQRLLAMSLDGLRANDTFPSLPGRPPSLERYVGAWERANEPAAPEPAAENDPAAGD